MRQFTLFIQKKVFNTRFISYLCAQILNKQSSCVFGMVIKRMLFIVWLVLVPLSVLGKIYAVLVGVSEYESSTDNLTYCHQDAIEMYELFKEHTTPERMKLLTDRQAKHDNIVYCTRQLFRQAQPDDMVLFFFSGHGTDNMFFTHDKALHFSTLQSIFRQCKARRKLIFADACFAGTLRQPGNRATPNHVNLGNNVLLFLSSRSNQYSRESSSLRNGLFTYFLLAGLKGGADANRDGYITARELFNFVYPKVRERSDDRQIPVMWGKFDENMIILRRQRQ